jgi:CheY-like chemotaxis protein
VARILLADDDDQLRGLMRHALERAGHDVVAVSDGLAAVRLATQRSIDLFLCDLCMPNLDGIETIWHFRAVFPVVPVIAMSAMMDRLSTASKLGAAGVLAKPFSVAKLLALVNDLLPVFWNADAG